MISNASTIAGASGQSPCGTSGVERNGLCPSQKAVLPTGGYLTVSPRVRLVTSAIVKVIRGVDGEKVMAMVDNFLNPHHLRFAFNVALTPDHSVRDLRFWGVELAAPALVNKLTVHEAICEILGTRKFWPREELGIAWQISPPQIVRLIRGKCLNLEGGKVSRSCLESFLCIRWTGNNPI